MTWFWVPILVAACIVLQGTLNQRLSESWGLLRATALNNLIVMVFTIFFLLLSSFMQRSSSSLFNWPSDWKWWYVIPGFCGTFIVLGLPFGLKRMSSASFFVVLIAAQIVLSLVWDYGADGVQPSWQRWMGALMVILGSLLAIR